jgi:hypothetical protein
LAALGSVLTQAQKFGGPTSTQMAGGGKWRVRYSYDEMHAGLSIQDFQFLSERRAVGLGVVYERGKGRPVTLLTSDGGKSWTLDRAPEAGYSFHFLNDSLGWMTTGKGIWQSEEAGRSWKRISKQSNINRLFFTSPTQGYAAATSKAAYETKDGGKTWTKLDILSKVQTNADTTSFEWIGAREPSYIAILGQSIPAVRSMPYAPRPREYPNTLISLESSDGGQHWTSDSTSIFGKVARLRMQPDGRALLLLQYLNRFAYSSELYAMNYATHSSVSRFRATEVFLTDVQWTPDGTVYLAGVQRSGESSQPMLPGAVHVYRSKDSEHWEEMPVDYKASAQRVMLSVSGPDNLWLATDSGMILRWVASQQ